MRTTINHALGATGISALLLAAALGCAPEFDDPTMAVLKKPEIISVVLEPPEAAPGETVTASFLLADERGVIDGRAALWLPTAGGSGDDPEALLAALEWLGLELPELAAPSLTFTVGPAALYQFDAAGFAGQPLTLFAAVSADPDPATPVEQLLALLEQLVADEKLEVALRTLAISARETRNRNPEIVSVSSGDADAADQQLQIAHCGDPDLAASRQLAADNPLVLTEKSKVHFHAEVSDDDGAEALRYQWISTGGDFGGLREQVQEWKVPRYRELEDGDEDQTGMENVDPRKDPNLHPVFLIVRDDLADNRMGQAFAEFYVRVTPEG